MQPQATRTHNKLTWRKGKWESNPNTLRRRLPLWLLDPRLKRLLERPAALHLRFRVLLSLPGQICEKEVSCKTLEAKEEGGKEEEGEERDRDEETNPGRI